MALNYSWMERPSDRNPALNHLPDIPEAAARAEEGEISYQEQKLQNIKLRSEAKENTREINGKFHLDRTVHLWKCRDLGNVCM